MQKGFALLVFLLSLGILLIVLIVLSTSISLTATKDAQLNPSTNTPTAVAKDNLLRQPAGSLSGLPELFPHLQWSILEKPTLGEYTLFYNNWDYTKDPKKSKDGYISLDGKEWFTEQQFNDEKETWELKNKFGEYYEAELTKRGWTFKVSTNSFEISGAAADAPGDSIWGYVKLNEDKIQTITLRTSFWSKIKNQETLEYSCPCTLKLWVFVSGTVSVNSILPLLLNQSLTSISI